MSITMRTSPAIACAHAACVIFFLFVCLSCEKKREHSATTPVVRTNAGFISGTIQNDVAAFKGVPFATPPVNELRWKAPQPLASWRDTLDCTQFGASPVQNDPKPFMMWTQEFITPDQPLSENCLFLNIWTPSVNAEGKLPVLVWIHGGGFVSGSGACPVYDGEALAKKGIVFVSINYRLGIFGFIAHPELTRESDTRSSGNYGLMDQVEALRWINKNIAAFGGDPTQITIAGQSAGSMSVQALVASPLANGLFNKAIAESGGLTGRSSVSLSEAEANGILLSTKANVKDLEALRQLPADRVLELAGTFPYGSFAPIVDGHVIPGDPGDIFDEKKHNDVALLAGWVTGDGDLVMRDVKTAAEFKAYAKETYPTRSNDFLMLFPSGSDDESKTSQRRLGLSRFAALPAHQWALANTGKSYLYEFTYVPTDKPGFPNYGAFHTSEVPFALHTLAFWDRPWTDQDRTVEKYMSSYWVNFVKTGNPNGEGLPAWKPYTASEGVIMVMGKEPVSQPGYFKSIFEFLATAP
jgi:para-nitrobenzyl esterase